MTLAGRLLNFVAIGVGILLIVFGQFMAVSVLEDTGDAVVDSGENIDTYNGEQVIRDANRAATQIVPTIGGIGLFLIGAAREYRMQQVGRRVRQPPGGGFP